MAEEGLMKHIIKTFKDGELIDVQERDYTPDEALTQWKASISATDAKVPRYVEDIIDALDPSVRARIAAETLSAYQAKKTLRLQKPEEK